MDAKEFLTHWENSVVETNYNGFEVISENLEKSEVRDWQVLANNSANAIHYRKTIKELSDFKFALDQAAIVAITDQYGIIRYVNDKFCELSKYTREELIGQNHRIIKSGYHPPEFFQKFWQTIKAGKVWKGEIKNKAKDGTYYWVDTTVVPFVDETGEPYQYLSIRFDITERKEAEAALRQSELLFRQQAREIELALVKLKQTQSQLVQSEKMSTMGQLIAGIAHEINNPVNFIYGNLHHTSEYIDLLLKILHLYQQHYPAAVPEIQELVEYHDLEFILQDLPKCLDSMQLGANRIREIVLSLRNFSRLDEPHMKPVNIHEGLDSTLLILQNRLKGKPGYPEITLIKEYSDLPPVVCYGSQLNQVFMNIICNAIDALENQPAPREIVIRTSVTNTEVENGRREKEENHQFAVISIANNGPGIPDEIQQQLFDPFFTTKAMGKGTGLGLSIAYHIVVEKHQGQLKCISHPGAGVEFAIAIPLSPCPKTIKRI